MMKKTAITQPTLPTHTTNLEAFNNALTDLAWIYKGMTLIQMRVLVGVATNQPTNATELSAYLSIDKNTVSRSVDLLRQGPSIRRNYNGLDLIYSEQDNTNRCLHILRLTKKGELLAKLLSSRLTT